MTTSITPWCGKWSGTMRTWFQPGTPVEEAPIEATLEPLLDGAMIAHSYQSSLQGTPLKGTAIYGYDDAARATAMWADTFHTGGSVFNFVADSDGGFSVLGSYGTGEGSPRWGWRITVTMPDDDHLLVVHENIEPSSPPAKAIEMDLRRA